MSLFRNQAVLLDQRALTDEPLTGVALRVRPSDGDPSGDHAQSWRLFVDLAREGVGSVAVELWTSFDNAAWSRIARVATQKTPSVAQFEEVRAFAPYLQVRTVVTSAGDAPAPRHRATVRLASDGPFTVVPA